MLIAIGFFGITRSLKHTIKSIHEKVFDVFKENNIEYHIFIHTFHLTNYKNIRTGEVVNDIDNEEYKLLNAHYIQIDNQEEIKQNINMSLYRTHRDPWNTQYNSVDNFILAQYSKLKLTQMIEETKNNYKYILFMRPDCLYLDKFKIEWFDLINDNSIVIPNFHLDRLTKFNDRFSITIDKFSFTLISNIIGNIIITNKINIIHVKFNFQRIRFDGQIAKLDKIFSVAITS